MKHRDKKDKKGGKTAIRSASKFVRKEDAEEDDFGVRRLFDDGKFSESAHVFRNDALVVVDKISCFVPREVDEVVGGLMSKYPSVEFSIYVKGELVREDEERGITTPTMVITDWYLPEQEVTSAAVEYLEEVPDSTWNGVIHKHPSGVLNFSGTDDRYINQNFEFSLLYVNNRFQKGIINFTTTLGLRIQKEFDKILTTQSVRIPPNHATKIKTKSYLPAAGGYNYNRGYGGIYGYGFDAEDFNEDGTFNYNRNDEPKIRKEWDWKTQQWKEIPVTSAKPEPKVFHRDGIPLPAARGTSLFGNNKTEAATKPIIAEPPVDTLEDKKLSPDELAKIATDAAFAEAFLNEKGTKEESATKVPIGKAEVGTSVKDGLKRFDD